MMDFRKRFFVITSVVVALLLVLLLLFLVLSRREPATETTEIVPSAPVSVTDTTVPTETPNAPATQPVTPTPVAEPGELYVKQLARLFVERSGSYSNQNNNQHLDEVAQFATPRVMTWMRSQAPTNGGVFQGHTTTVVVVKTREYATDRAVVEVGAQEAIETGGTEEVKYKIGRVEFVNVGGVWKVDGVFWES